MSETQALEIMDVLRALPSEKLVEVKDFAVFLKERYGDADIVDYSDEWTDEDLRDFSAASFAYFEKSEQEGEDAV